MKSKIILLCLITLLLSACNNGPKNTENIQTVEDEIIRVGVSDYGGGAGVSMNLSITQDSTIYLFMLASQNNFQRQYTTTTADSLWKELLSIIDLPSFKQIQSGYSHQSFDGTDRKFFIITKSKKEYSFINGENDSNYLKNKPFFDLLLHERIRYDEIAQKIN